MIVNATTAKKPAWHGVLNAVLLGVAVAGLTAFTANQVEEFSTRLASHKPTVLSTQDGTASCVVWRGNASCFERTVAAEMDAAEGSQDTGLSPEEFLKRLRVAQLGEK